METPDSLSVKNFIRQSLDDICQFPGMFADTAEKLAGLLKGLDVVRRFCDGVPAGKSRHGFTGDCDRKGIEQFQIMELLRDRLNQNGESDPTEVEKMKMLIQIWTEVTEFQPNKG